MAYNTTLLLKLLCTKLPTSSLLSKFNRFFSVLTLLYLLANTATIHHLLFYKYPPILAICHHIYSYIIGHAFNLYHVCLFYSNSKYQNSSTGYYLISVLYLQPQPRWSILTFPLLFPFAFIVWFQSSPQASFIPASLSEASPSQACLTCVHVSMAPSLFHTASFFLLILLLFVLFWFQSSPQRLETWPQVFSLLEIDVYFSTYSILKFIRFHSF